MNEKVFMPSLAIGVIGWLLTLALIKEMNGTLLTAAIGAISGIAGYVLKGLKNKVY